MQTLPPPPVHLEDHSPDRKRKRLWKTYWVLHMSWKVPYALVTAPLTSLPAGMLLFTSILRRIHTQLPHTIPHDFYTLILVSTLPNGSVHSYPLPWTLGKPVRSLGIHHPGQRYTCRPWQSEHERAPLGWISRGSTYAHCACAGQPALAHTLDRRLISVTPHSPPFSSEAVEPMLSWSSHKKEVGLRHRSPSGAPPGISSTESP